MEILKKIILANNKQPILLHCDSRNDNSLSKIHQNCKTNFSNSNNNLKAKNIILKNSIIKSDKYNKTSLSNNKMNISLENKNIKIEKENQTNNDYQVISYINIDKKNHFKNSRKANMESNYILNKNYTINNNITNNISNNITNIIVSNNSNNSKFNLKKKFLNSHKKINLDEKKIIFNNTKYMNNSQRNKNINKIINNKKNIQIRNFISFKNKQYSLTNANNDLFYNKKNCALSNRNNILSEKLITTKDIKDIKKKTILERNVNKLKVCLTTSSINNININQKLKNSNIHLIKKHILDNNSIKFKNSINNIEINSYKNKLKKANKIKDNNSINKNKPVIENKFRPSLKYLEDTISLNNVKIKDKEQIKNLKKIQVLKNYIINYNCNSSRGKEQKYLKNLKTGTGCDSNSHINKDKIQNKSNVNINIDNMKSVNKLLYLVNNKNISKSFTDKNNRNLSNISYISNNRGHLKTNNFNKVNKTFIYPETKNTKSKSKSNKTKNIIYNFRNFHNKNKNKVELINSNFKTERNINNLKSKKSNIINSNITSFNNIANKINIYNNKNKSFIINYNLNLLKNKSFQDRKKRSSMNMNLNINIHKNLKKEFLTKSLIKKNDQSNFLNSFKSNNYNTYKEQFLLNLVNSYKNLSYVSHEKNNKNNKNKEKKNKYYNAQKRIHEKKISKIKKNNRCKKDSLDLSTINMHHNDLVNLAKIKINKNKDKNKNSKSKSKSKNKNINENKISNKELVFKPIYYYKRKSPEYLFRNKNELKKGFLSYDESKNVIKNEIKKITNKKQVNTFPINILKNFRNFNYFNDNSFQEGKIKSVKISPNSSNIQLIKSFGTRNPQLKQNKSYKISMYHIFNRPHNNTISLNKKKKKKISINDTDNSKEKNKNKRKQNSLQKSNNSIFDKEIKKNENNNLQTFEISDEENEKTKVKNNKENCEKEQEDYNIIKNEKIKNNPQFLCDYIIDILENFLIEETFYLKKQYINPDYLYSDNNTELTPEIRIISINWLIMINHKVFKFKENTLFLCIQIIDRFLSKKMLNIEKTELLILCALILASKHEEMDYVNMTESLQLSSNKFTKEQIINMEYEILNELNFEIIIPNMNDYYNVYAIIYNLSDIEKNRGLYLLNIVLCDYYLLEYPNFILALAVIKIIVKKSVKYLIEIIKDLMTKNNEDLYLDFIMDEKEIDKLCDKIKLLYKKFISTKYKSIQDKFSEEKYNSVSNNSNDLFI